MFLNGKSNKYKNILLTVKAKESVLLKLLGIQCAAYICIQTKQFYNI